MNEPIELNCPTKPNHKMPTKGDIKQVEGCTDYLEFNGKRWHRFHENGKDAGIGVWGETDEVGSPAPRWFLRPRARRFN
jgi:hypothetical protein